MPPGKSSKGGAHDDAKGDSKNGHSPGNHTSSGKMRRVASSTGSQLREVTNASSSKAGGNSSKANNAAKDDGPAPGIDWSSFDRDMLHAYRCQHRLGTPTSFSSSYRHMIMSQPGTLGMYSPTMARRREDRRQSKEHLALAVRKHFNGVGVHENDVIVDFIHKVRSHSITKADRLRRSPPAFEAER